VFEVAEIGQKVSKAEFERRQPALRIGLVNAQYDLRDQDFPVVIVLAGSDRAGCTDVLHGLHEVMDGRYVETVALGRPTEEELERPHFWRYWRRLPRRGQIGAFLGAWPLDVIVDRLSGDIDDVQLEQRIEHIARFEETLADDGALLLKFWLHISKAELRKRLRRAKKDPDRYWQVDDRDRRLYRAFDEAVPIAERMIRGSSTGQAPWQIVESADARFRDLRIADAIHDGITRRLTAARARAAAPRARRRAPRRGRTILETVDLRKTVRKDAYRAKLQQHQAVLSRLSRQARATNVSSILVLEGWDAAGKGGVIRRITAAMNPETYHLVPVAAPTEDERARHYLWRFWRHLPRAGHVTIFDRSWYGRVLVERVEGLARRAEWQRAYSEINDFEAQLCEHGILLLKFWLHIDREEQLRRFRKRQKTPFKKYKITEEDFRNRARWPEYTEAVHEMVGRTSSAHAPWHLVPANSKRWARIEVLETYTRALEQRL
jgi:polyphosphate:AMP phosphotransferase